MNFKSFIAVIFFVLIIITCNDLNDNKILGTVSIPLANPPEGDYNDSQMITLTTTTIDATIYYTLDGSTPTVNSNIYLDPILVNLGNTLKAYAIKAKWNDSEILTAKYTQKGTVNSPVAIPESGIFIAGQTITLSTTTQGALIYYTIDGSEPNINSIKYFEPINLTSNVIIKAIAIKDGLNDSSILSETYNINNIYIVGYFNDGMDGYNNSLRKEACYWINGQRHFLSVPIGSSDAEARGIAASDGNIYIVGDVYLSNIGRRALYWVNGQQNEILINVNDPNPVTNSIAVENGNIYITGYYITSSPTTGSSPTAFIWINGQIMVLPSPSVASRTTSIVVSDNTPYISGYYGHDYHDERACYWVNDQRIDLPFSGTRSVATSIAVYGNTVYISGWYNDGNSNTIACYWVNGEKIDLLVPGTTTSNIDANANSIYIEDNSVYIAAYYYYQTRRTSCYWVDGQVIDLTNVTLPTIRNIAVFNEQIYIIGQSLWGNAFYWVNDRSYPLESDSNTYSDAYDIIIVGE